MSSSTLHTLALGTALLASPTITFIGLRFLFAPRIASAGYGIALDDSRSFTFIKGIRDIVSGLVLLAVYRSGGPVVLGWAVLVSSLTALGDMMVVLSRGVSAGDDGPKGRGRGKGNVGQALGVHGVTAGVLFATGLTLIRA